MASSRVLISRRRILSASGALIGLIAPAAFAKPAPIQVDVWKDPNCGCCKEWISHMQEFGFTFNVHESGNTRARAKFGVPQQFGSCHTAMVDGYVLEGHVPAKDVLRLLKEKPDALGLAVPGMPMGSPGMEGGRKDPFKVLLLSEGREVTSTVFSIYQ